MGGYRKKITRVVEVTPAMAVPPRPKGPPVPPGINEVLKAKLELRKDIQRYFDGYYNVSINVKDNKWVLEVRGYDYPVDFFQEYEVIVIPSVMVRNPKSRML
jgi:mRNA-degrading endonuclease HigB of HigAB toxin-antitoxin module